MAHATALKTGEKKSCGCWRRERASKLTYKHGERGGEKRKALKATPEYKTWELVKQRCFDPTCAAYKVYGARGITLAPEWRYDFGSFLAYMGRRPPPLGGTRYTLDRIDSKGNYEPGNVRWATWKEQARNRSNNHIVTFRGRRMTLVEASEMAGIEYKTLKGRLQHGWSVDRALAESVNQKKRDAARRNPGKAIGSFGKRSQRNCSECISGD